MNIGSSNWNNSSFDPTKMKFFTLYQFLTRLLSSNHLNIIIIYCLGEMEQCEKRAFQLLKMGGKNSLNIKPKYVTDYILTVRSSRMKDYTCHYVVGT